MYNVLSSATLYQDIRVVKMWIYDKDKSKGKGAGITYPVSTVHLQIFFLIYVSSDIFSLKLKMLKGSRITQ